MNRTSGNRPQGGNIKPTPGNQGEVRKGGKTGPPVPKPPTPRK